MHINQVLMEVPLPDDWDKSIYSDKVPFKKRVEYAKSKAKRLGGGTSRIAFQIPYQGRNTVLKVAKNTKGMAQNEQEVGMFRSAEALGASGTVVVPMIDYDESSSKPTWIHVEYAPVLKSTKQFEQLTGYNLEDAINYIAELTANRSLPFAHQDTNKDFDSDEAWEDEYMYNLFSFIGNTEINLPDLLRPANWGVYKNKPVIIDLGISEDIFRQYYAK